jgi:hypothetical protein
MKHDTTAFILTSYKLAHICAVHYQMLGFRSHHRPINSAAHMDTLLRHEKTNFACLDLKIHNYTGILSNYIDTRLTKIYLSQFS